jgi:hypothetical protein
MSRKVIRSETGFVAHEAGAMDALGFSRYVVHGMRGDVAGVVFPYFTDVDTRRVRWTAQTRHGLVYSRFLTRKAAVAFLLERQ